jgi:hypothetical protein
MLTDIEHIRKRYFDMAENHKGTSGMILKSLGVLARQIARDEVRAKRCTKWKIADAFYNIAKECLEEANTKGWENNHALDIAKEIRETVMSIKV